MTTTTIERPTSRSTRRPRPQLLLPPVAEPVGTTIPQPAVPGPQAPVSVLRPPVERRWPTGPGGPPPAELPDPDRLCGAVVLAAVEALGSTRPLAQLVRWVTPEVFEALADAVRPPGTGPQRQRPVIRSARVCRVSPAVTEGAVVVHDGDRVRAAAVRMEVRRGNWRVTALQIG